MSAFPGKSIQKGLTPHEVSVEASRCLYCYDAPCTRACPTHINIAGFIAQIADGNLKGSARTILEANPMGASCARVCPVEELCEGACVYNTESETPIRIGDLQRYATDVFRESGERLFVAGDPTGRSVAIIGGGPAGLSAARELRRSGHAVTIFEARSELGGLNTYGIVPFRLAADVALWEAQQVVELGCEVRKGVVVGEDLTTESLTEEFDAVVLACGMGYVPKLGIPNEEYALDAIALIERAKMTGSFPGLGKSVAVIGAGNTAIDALTCAKRLGAEQVTMYYRRGEEHMTAYRFEYDFAKEEGIEFRFFCKPTRVLVEGGSVVGVEFARTRIVGGPSTTVASLPALGMTSVTDDERRIGDDAAKVAIEVVEGSEFVVACDTVVRAIGQSRLISTLGALGVQHDGGVVRVDERMRTTRQGVFAAGDCIFAKGSREAMVVEAAEQGKIAASSVNEYLAMTSGKHPRAAGGNSSGARDDG